MLSRERAQGLRVRPSCPRFGLRSAVLTRIHVADDRTEIGAQRWNLTNLHTLPLEARWVENQLCKNRRSTLCGPSVKQPHFARHNA